MVKEFTEGQKFSALQETEKKFQRRRKKEKENETDDHRLQQRSKQIAYGENTPGYSNFLRALESNPSLLKGCLPVKPSVNQKCSKRSWDGQIRKWRRALHMYDFVDFGDSAAQTEAVREALIDQNRNPLFMKPKRLLPDGKEVLLTPHPEPNPDVKLPPDFDVDSVSRVRYTHKDLMKLSDSPLISPTVDFPENLRWLDKRVDLEDDAEDSDDAAESPSGEQWLSPFTPGYSSASSSPAPQQARRHSPLGTPLRLFAETPGYNSPTASVGHYDDSLLDTIGVDSSLDEGGKGEAWPCQVDASQQPRLPWGKAGEVGDLSPMYTLFTASGESVSLFNGRHFKSEAQQEGAGASYFTAGPGDSKVEDA